jgi:hypothetical protein
MWCGRTLPTFQRNVPSPSSGSKNKPNKQASNKQIAYSLTLMKEAGHSSKTSVNQTTWQNVRENGSFHIIAMKM